MPPTQAGLFQLLSARMHWLGQREVVLGQNVANADTPDYRPRDLRADAFARLLEGGPASGALGMSRTDTGHLAPGGTARLDLAAQEVDSAYEESPDGNAVVLEEQMAKLSETAMSYQLTTNLYRKYVGMVRTALGVQA